MSASKTGALGLRAHGHSPDQTALHGGRMCAFGVLDNLELVALVELVLA